MQTEIEAPERFLERVGGGKNNPLKDLGSIGPLELARTPARLRARPKGRAGR
ncbi:MAG: hypothetical protein MZV70_54400 [Desulfobacterales bacterium]|nr:hypothetical protein [Desulfobacterales bacterium]